MSFSVLVVEDERELLWMIVDRLKRKGYSAQGVSSGEEALELLKKHDYDIGIFDIRLPGISGLELLEKAKNYYSEMEVIILTGHGTIDSAIEAMKLGAYDYLTKPCRLAKLELVVDKALERKRLREENKNIKQLMATKEADFHIVGESPQMKKVISMVKNVADSHVPVLILGETGTGKELFAKALHYWSCRAGESFVAINSGALPEQLLESELFGHVKGAFTGAIQSKKGLVEVADGGTLFLDEIGEMPLNLQVKLLRFLETGEFRPVGDVSLRQVKVRVVAATNRNLMEEVKNGRFREDLYYRLNVLSIKIPSLRERISDLPHLVDFYFKSNHIKNKKLSSEAMEALKRYSFPGNVRELFHILERGNLLAKGPVIEPRDLMLPTEKDETAFSPASLAEVEKKHIAQVLNYTNGNKTQAAKILKISVRNLYRKIQEYGLQ